MGFINALAATSRGESEFDQFTFDLANYFPAREFPADSGSGFLSFFMSNEKLVTKKILFDKEKLAVFKQLDTSPPGSTVKDPTRVEVVSAFIWKHFLEVAKLNNLENKKTFAQ
ncbi:hypothetical protein BUALT_Bualt19G0052100 [Buddleja alternifolia]|uniref:DM2 domain-containing protein n=1 Tax=Buddleja alternifolia TaxID=168488 RepID=A0AAV6W7L3_9LAMI|nr:hypothetical protein BUALT_Bualt19G0052100 [Buddleja alternifolia]